jgi:hypothetical protein
MSCCNATHGCKLYVAEVLAASLTFCALLQTVFSTDLPPHSTATSDGVSAELFELDGESLSLLLSPFPGILSGSLLVRCVRTERARSPASISFLRRNLPAHRNACEPRTDLAVVSVSSSGILLHPGQTLAVRGHFGSVQATVFDWASFIM